MVGPIGIGSVVKTKDDFDWAGYNADKSDDGKINGSDLSPNIGILSQALDVDTRTRTTFGALEMLKQKIDGTQDPKQLDGFNQVGAKMFTDWKNNDYPSMKAVADQWNKLPEEKQAKALTDWEKFGTTVQERQSIGYSAELAKSTD